MKMIKKSIILSGVVALAVSSLNARSSVQYVDVISSSPVYRTVNVRVPYEEVISKAYTVRVPCGNTYTQQDTNSIGLDTIIGMGLGIAAGNQIGKGNGRTVAKIAGGLLGAGIANNNRDPKYQTTYCNETRYKDEVVTKYDYVEEEKLQGYDNTFMYNGIKYTKRTKRPRKTIKITTSISF